MPWFIGLTQTDSYARLLVTNHISQSNVARFGPFRTREDAQLYEEQVLSLHQLRRCTERLEPSFDHPGCIYGEMNQCLRPCQGAVSPQEYMAEAGRISEFLVTAGRSTVNRLSAARDRAAADLDFEQAAQAHKRLEKAQAALAARDIVVTEVSKLNGVALTRAHSLEGVNMWPLFAGYWQTPIQLYLPACQAKETASLDAVIRERLQAALEFSTATGSRMEQIALFSRWYYSSWRDGSWFAFETLAQLNYRRLVKAISNLAKPAAPC